MAENKDVSVAAAQDEMVDQWFDLLPIEKKLLSYTFGLGIVLLIIFFFVFGVHI